MARGIGGAIVAPFILAVTPLGVRDPDRAGATRGGRGLVASLRDVLSTSAARRLLAVQFVEAAGVGAVGTMGPYIAEYLLRRPDAVALLPGAYVVAGVVAIPLWVLISRRIGARETWMAAMLLAAAAFAGIWFVGPGDLVPLLGLLVVAGAAMGCGGVLSNALLADVIDLDAQRTGERKEGVYSAAMLLAVKVGTALALAASGPVMTTAGFTPNVEQTEASLVGIRFLFAGLPCARLPDRRVALPRLLARRRRAARDPGGSRAGAAAARLATRSRGAQRARRRGAAARTERKACAASGSAWRRGSSGRAT